MACLADEGSFASSISLNVFISIQETSHRQNGIQGLLIVIDCKYTIENRVHLCQATTMLHTDYICIFVYVYANRDSGINCVYMRDYTAET